MTQEIDAPDPTQKGPGACDEIRPQVITRQARIPEPAPIAGLVIRLQADGQVDVEAFGLRSQGRAVERRLNALVAFLAVHRAEIVEAIEAAA